MITRVSWIRAALGCAAIVAGLQGCSDASAPESRLDRVKITFPGPRFGGITAGATMRFTAVALDRDGIELKIVIVWSTSDSTIVSVDQTGTIRPLGSGKSAVITATASDGSRTARDSITVSVITLL